MIRLFVAAELPGEIRDGLQRVIVELKKRGADSGVRWARPEGSHLTLKFLGDTPEDSVNPIVEALRTKVAGLGRFTLVPSGIGTFGKGSHIRVVWLGLGGDVDRLRLLAGKVEEALDPLGYPREERGFHPHLTLGRVRREATKAQQEELLAAVEKGTNVSFPPFEVPEVALVRSVLHPQGAQYEVLARITLC